MMRIPLPWWWRVPVGTLVVASGVFCFGVAPLVLGILFQWMLPDPIGIVLGLVFGMIYCREIGLWIYDWYQAQVSNPVASWVNEHTVRPDRESMRSE